MTETTSVPSPSLSHEQQQQQKKRPADDDLMEEPAAKRCCSTSSASFHSRSNCSRGVGGGGTKVPQNLRYAYHLRPPFYDEHLPRDQNPTLPAILNGLHADLESEKAKLKVVQAEFGAAGDTLREAERNVAKLRAIFERKRADVEEVEEQEQVRFLACIIRDLRS
ncbi:hypothetical protein BDV12DRAFT_195046 [Aspergillus spectabilis]